MWIGIFTPRLLARVCTTPETRTLRVDDPPGGFCRRLPEQHYTRLGSLFAEVEQSAPEPARFNAGLGYALLSAWEAYRSAEEPAAGPGVYPAVEQAARTLRDEAEQTSVEQIARGVGLHLYGPGKGVSVSQAALEARLGSYPQFHRVFKQEMGCGPAQYWRQMEKGIGAGSAETDPIV